MSDTLEQQRDDAAPSPAPEPSSAPTDGSQSNAPAPSDALDDLLQQYDAAVKQADAGPSAGDGELQQDAIASLLRDMDVSAVPSHADARIAELQNRNAALEAHIHREQETAAFKSFAADLQNQLPETVPPDFAETALKAAAMGNSDLVVAFDLRNVDRRDADAELRKVEAALNQLARNPNADQNALAALRQYGYRLGLALNSAEILRRAKADIVARAKSFKPIDPDATADRAMVAAAVRDANHKIEPSPPPDLANMSAQDFRDYQKSLGLPPAV
jgi:hypothetical protein